MPGSDAVRRGLALLLVATLAAGPLAGCYAYQPVGPDTPPRPGADVRLRYEEVTEGRSLWQREGVRASTLDGRVLEWSDERVLLAVHPPPTGMSRTSPHPDTIDVPVAGITSVQLRELNRVRTGAAIGAGAVLGAVLVHALFSWTRRGAPPDQPGPGTP